jgi:hypothetical protein
MRAARRFLRVFGADTRNNDLVLAVVAWFRQESGSVSRVIGNNPFNIRPGAASKYASGTRRGRVGGFLTFTTFDRGFMAAAVVLRALAPAYGYGLVIKAARAGDPIGFLAALARSSWSSSHYGARNAVVARTPTNHLVAVYLSLARR